MKDLTTSDIHRKNVLNNSLALKEIYNELSFPGIMFEGKYRFTKKQIASFFEVDERTVDRYLESYESELNENGYQILSGDRLKDFKTSKVDDIYVVDLMEVGVDKFAPTLGVFTFKAFLNMGMLLTESETAKQLRAIILDIVIDTLNKKVGGKTKYINQREEEFLPSALREYDYRKAFTDAIDFYIEQNKFKYGQLTDRVYLSVFKEKAKEYRQILKLKSKESVRATMYSEVLDLIASYENGFADYLKKRSEKLGRKFKTSESILLFKEFEENTEAIFAPLRERARSLMASRDMAFRDALHEKLKQYVSHLSADEFDKFLGERSMELEARINDNIDVFKRLKDR